MAVRGRLFLCLALAGAVISCETPEGKKNAAPQAGKGGGGAKAGPVVQGPAVPAIDPKADAILKKMGETLKNASSFSFKLVSFEDRVLSTGLKVQYDKAGVVTVQRPDKMRVEFSKRGDDRIFVYDGKSVTLAADKRKLYATAKAPPTLDGMFDMLDKKLGMTMPLADFCFADPYKVLTENMLAGTYLGKTTIFGLTVHHMIFSHEGVDWQIWVEDGKRAAPRRVLLTYLDEEDDPQYIASMSDWDFSPQIPRDAFTYTPPAGAEKISIRAEKEE